MPLSAVKCHGLPSALLYRPALETEPEADDNGATHYVRHNAWLEDGILLRNAGVLSNIPGVLVSGRFDFQAPIANAWELKRAWPRATAVIVDDAGHGADPRISQELVRAIDRFAGPTSRA